MQKRLNFIKISFKNSDAARPYKHKSLNNKSDTPSNPSFLSD